jgi:hypothetical protein
MLSFRVSRLAVPLFLLLSSGCVVESENKGKIEGTRWTSEASTVSVPNPRMPGTRQSVTVPSGYMELDFQKDGTLFYIINGKLYRGKYSLNGGQTVTLKLEEKLSGRYEHAEKIVVEGQRLTMTDTDGTSLKFRKNP